MITWFQSLGPVAQGGVAALGTWSAAIGFLAGAALLFLLDQALPHLHPEFPDEARREGPPVLWWRSALLIAAITLHHSPAIAARDSSRAGRWACRREMRGYLAADR